MVLVCNVVSITQLILCDSFPILQLFLSISRVVDSATSVCYDVIFIGL